MSKVQALLALVESVVDVSDFEGDDGVEVIDGEAEEEQLTEALLESLDGDFILVEELAEGADPIEEARKVKIVRVRGGKIQRIQKVICPPGYRAQGDKCVKMSAGERAARKRAAVKNSKKTQTGAARRKRLISVRKAARIS